MGMALQITLILVVVALTAGLLPLIFQCCRTAKALEVFLESAQKDLNEIAEDVRISRQNLDQLTVTLKGSLVEVSVFASALGVAGRALRDCQLQFQSRFEAASRLLGGLLGGLGSALSLFRSQPSTRGTEEGRTP